MGYRTHVRTLFAMCIGLATGCTTGDRSSQLEPRHAPRAPETADATLAPTAADPLREAPAPERPQRVYYDLAEHLAHAELRRGSTLLVDFGVAGDAKYTLGGWGTRVRSPVHADAVSAAAVRGSYGDFLLPLERGGGLAVTARVRVPRGGQLTVYFDEKVIARVKTDPKRFETVRVVLPEEQATPGEHMLRLRAQGMGNIGSLSTALAVDWLTLGSADEHVPSEVPAPTLDGQNLRLPTGLSLGYAMRVPGGARLSAGLSGAAPAQLVVRAVLDDGSVVPLGSHGPGALQVDLGGLEGKLVRLDLEAQGELTLAAPRITMPREAPPRELSRPVKNVLVYLIDTLRADHLKPFNPDTRVRTPGLEQLVALGSAVFTAAHTQENWTKPSVATLLSSLMPWEHHAVTTEAVVPKSIQLLPELLQERGFHTGAFIANGYVSDKFGFKQGFDTFRNYIREGRYSRAQFLAADVLQWLDQRPKELPFFLYVHAIDPHVPYRPTKEFLSLYDPLPYKGVVSFASDPALLEKIKVGKIKLDARDKQHLEALYDSEISYHDVHFRAITEALQQRGLAEDTMVVVVADHGEEFWDHGSVGHGHSVYEELLRIPMVIRLPGVTPRPERIASSAGLVDVMPTVLEALGEAVPEGLSGRSLLPELRGAGTSAPSATVAGFMDGWRAAVISGLKLIQRTEKRWMLYDLAADPDEQNDVAPARPVSTRYLRGQLGLMLAATRSGEQAPPGKKHIRQQNTEIDAETEAQLQALGYVGTSRR